MNYYTLSIQRYLIAIYDKHSNTVTFRDTNEMELAPVLKRLKAEQPEEPEPIQDVIYDYHYLFILKFALLILSLYSIIRRRRLLIKSLGQRKLR
jgi:hypothetical protein